MEQVATVGRIVHFTMQNMQVRPAIIVHVWTPDTVQLQVFLDSTNDASITSQAEAERGLMHKSSVTRAEYPSPGRWNWPPRA